MSEEINPRWGRFDYQDWHESWTVQSMSWKEQGLYSILLKLQFKNGAIPADPKVCGRMIGVGASGPEFEDFEATFEAIVGHFEQVDGDPSKLRNPRQHAEREKAIAKIKQKIAAGKASGRSRRQKSAEESNTRSNARSNTRSTDAATAAERDIDVDVDVVTEDVSNETGSPDVENSTSEDYDPHARFGALARELGQNRSNTGRWINWAKARSDHAQAERIMRGLVSLRDRGGIEGFIKPGEGCAPGTLHAQHEGQPIERYAEHEFHRTQNGQRKGPRRSSGPATINVEIGGAA